MSLANPAVSKDRARFTYAVLLFVLLCVVYLLVPFHRVSPAVIAVDIMRDTGIDGAAMGFLASVFFLTYGFMQLPAGILADHWGPRRTLPVFLTLAGLGAAVFGFGESVPLLMAGRALMGVGVSVIFVCGVKLMTVWFPPEAFARVNGLYLGMGGVGLILASGPTAYLSAHLGWRYAFLVCGAASVVIALALHIWVRDTPQEKGFDPYTPTRAPGERTKTPVEEKPLSMRESVAVIFKNNQFWLVSVWFFSHFTLHMSFGGLWGGPYLMDVHGLDKVAAGNILNMTGFGMLAGAPLAGWLSDSVFKARRPVMLIYAAVLCCIFGLLAAWGHELPLWGLYIWFFCLAAFGMGGLSMGFAAMRDVFGPAVTGTSSGFLNALPSVGMIVFQPLTGWLLEQSGKTDQGGYVVEGYAAACMVYAAIAAIGFLGAWKAKEPMHCAR